MELIKKLNSSRVLRMHFHLDGDYEKGLKSSNTILQKTLLSHFKLKINIFYK